MKLIKEDFAELCYNEILSITEESISPELKVPKYRRLFESIFKEIVKDEPQSFEGKYSLYGIIVFISEKYNLPNESNEIFHNFRKFANMIIHDTEYNKKIGVSLEEVEKFCIKSLCETVSFFSDIQAPDNLSTKYRDLKEFPELFSKKKLERETLNAIVIFLKISELKRNTKGIPYYTINCESEDDGTLFLLNIFPPYDNIGKYFKKFTKAYLHNVIKSANYENLYNTNENSLIVIEPDYLVEARNLSECFQNKSDSHYFYFINKFTYEPSSKEMIIGSIVNNMLDKYILCGNINFEDAFNGSIDILQCLRLTEEQIKQIKHEIQTHHLKNIIDFSKFCIKKNPIIEPTFISPEYGLYGRLDIMLEEESNQKDIIELKSGKAPNYEPWQSHKMQVTAYNMLLDSTYSNRTGTSSIFYSKAEKEYLKNVLRDASLYKRLINIRNLIVLNELRISEKNFSLFSELCNFDCSNYPDFIKKRFTQFSKTYNGFTDLELEYLHNFIYFIYNELRAAKIGTTKIYESSNNGFASFWLNTLQEKIENSSILFNLKFKEYNHNNEIYTFNLDKDNPISNFREGDICIIYSQNNKKPYKETQIYKGTIVTLNNDIVEIKLRNNQFSKEIFNSQQYWAIEHDLMEINYQNQIDSLFTFLTSDEEKKKKILGKIKPEYEKKEYYNKNYNENINTIISKFKSAKDYFLLQGPPGTGKTSLALKLMIEETFKDNPNSKIAILAYTNRAVDEISKNLSKSEKKIIREYIRIGSDYLSDERLLQKLVVGKTIDNIKKLIKDTKIFISTVSSFQKRYTDILDPGEKFDVIFVDEASQIVEPQIVGLLAQSKKFVLIGDHFQLPSVILQDENEYKTQSSKLQEIGLHYLSSSLFERLFIKCKKEKWDYAIDTLTTHYRMHNDIANLIKKNYSTELVIEREEQVREQTLFKSNSSDPIERILSRSRTLFIPSKLNKLESKYSTEEAKKIKLIIDTIANKLNHQIDEEKIGIITPWRIQINKIRSFINNEKILEKILIDTVERFQGSEKDIIIISLATNNAALFRNLQSENFDMTVDRKLNVALSRAKEHLILLGCEQIIKLSPHYNNAIQLIKKSGGYITLEESIECFKE
ncbi:MAG: AAA domain-containing protein [Ignavibacteria bacterium]|nr:AAA domain-containing protein [Ignavibacteria bacterium]